MPLVSVLNDINTDIGGALINSQTDVFADNLPVIIVGDQANPDLLCPIPGGTHCDPIATQGSLDVFVHNIPVHRFNDSRACGASTIVIGNTNVFVNGGEAPTTMNLSNPEISITPTQEQLTVYQYNITNVQQYNTPYNILHGVNNHPEMPDNPNIPVIPTTAAITNPNCVGGGDLGSAIDARLTEAQNGSWKETGHNSNIEQLYTNVGFPNIRGDQTAWCAAFVGSMLKDNCFKFNKSLAAGSYTNYNNPISISNAQKGDIIVFNRDGGTGHVALYYGPGPTPDTIYVVGGNQSNNVTKSLRNISDIKFNGVQRPIPA